VARVDVDHARQPGDETRLTGAKRGYATGDRRPKGPDVLGLIVVLLIVWLALIVIGAVIKGLFWLLIIGAVLFVATAAFGWVKRRV
jgi:hypothetical protein